MSEYMALVLKLHMDSGQNKLIGATVTVTIALFLLLFFSLAKLTSLIELKLSFFNTILLGIFITLYQETLRSYDHIIYRK
jgi:hypothetical protein